MSLRSSAATLSTRYSHTHQPPARRLQLRPLEEPLALRLLLGSDVRAEGLIASAVFLYLLSAPSRSDTPRAALVPEGHTGIVPPKCCLSWDSASLTG